jgi:hypothetical protein
MDIANMHLLACIALLESLCCVLSSENAVVLVALFSRVPYMLESFSASDPVDQSIDFSNFNAIGNDQLIDAIHPIPRTRP